MRDAQQAQAARRAGAGRHGSSGAFARRRRRRVAGTGVQAGKRAHGARAGRGKHALQAGSARQAGAGRSRSARPGRWARGLATGCALGALGLFSIRFDSVLFLSRFLDIVREPGS